MVVLSVMVMMVESGWITTELFREYIEHLWNSLDPKPTKEKPFILLMDGHSTRLDYDNVIWMLEHNIIPILFPPNSTGYLQALDAHGGSFHKLKVMNDDFKYPLIVRI